MWAVPLWQDAESRKTQREEGVSADLEGAVGTILNAGLRVRNLLSISPCLSLSLSLSPPPSSLALPLSPHSTTNPTTPQQDSGAVLEDGVGAVSTGGVGAIRNEVRKEDISQESGKGGLLSHFQRMGKEPKTGNQEGGEEGVGADLEGAVGAILNAEVGAGLEDGEEEESQAPQELWVEKYR